jgi:hypothetical protein
VPLKCKLVLNVDLATGLPTQWAEVNLGWARRMQVTLAASVTPSLVSRRPVGGEGACSASTFPNDWLGTVATGSMALPAAALVLITILRDVFTISTFVCTCERRIWQG